MSDARAAMRDNVARLLLRDIAAMKREIEQYPDDETPWRTVPGLTNAGGTLALHLAGNLQHFVGGVLGNTGHVRDRDAEFARRGVPRSELAAALDATSVAVRDTMRALDPATLGAEFPLEIAKVRLTTEAFLIHLATHIAYHLGQLDYHRRAVTGDATTVGTMAIPPLVEPWS